MEIRGLYFINHLKADIGPSIRIDSDIDESSILLAEGVPEISVDDVLDQKIDTLAMGGVSAAQNFTEWVVVTILTIIVTILAVWIDLYHQKICLVYLRLEQVEAERVANREDHYFLRGCHNYYL